MILRRFFFCFRQKKRKVSFPPVDAAVQKKIKVESPVVCNICLMKCRDAGDYE